MIVTGLQQQCCGPIRWVIDSNHGVVTSFPPWSAESDVLKIGGYVGSHCYGEGDLKCLESASYFSGVLGVRGVALTIHC